ncbi:MAG: sulfite exporter TauE/SafE family protein [Actinomycetota bacterium]|nr:sulfite exporter TauE/SafE family protein [Actinomycetota bacterium]
MDPLVVFFGLGVGLLVGLTGIGGGSLMTPLLIIVAGYSPLVAIGTDLAYGAVTKTVGGWRVWKQGLVDLRLSTWLAVGSMPGSLVGVWAVDRLHEAHGDDFQPYLLGAVAVALLLVATGVLFRAFFMPKHIASERDTADLSGNRKVATVGIGLVLGFILGLTSVGSGALIGLALILFFRLSPHRVVGTDVFHAAVLLWTAGIAHWVGGNVDFGLMGTILLGSIPGVWIGTGLLGKVPVDGLRPALGVVLFAAALGVLSKAGVDVPLAALVGLPVCLGIGAYALHRSRTGNALVT